MKRALHLRVTALVLAVAANASAQLTQGADIRTHDYNVDLYQGPILASTRVTGLAGAYVAIAEGVDGIPQNPASPAVRVPYSFDHFDYDLGIGFAVPSALKNTDFFNTGEGRTDSGATQDQNLVFLSLAANLQFGTWGFGLSADAQQYTLARSVDPAAATGAETLRGQFAVNHVLIARMFADGQLVLGAGVRSIVLSIIDPEAGGDEQERFSTEGAGFEAGVLWRPNNQQFRVGGAVRSAVRTTTDTPGEVLFQGTPDELWMPDEVTVPWDANLGLALQFGPRPLNPRWIDPSDLLAPARASHERREKERAKRAEAAAAAARARRGNAEAAQQAAETETTTEAALDELELEREEERVDLRLRERYANLDRFYVLVSTTLLVTGATDKAVGLESFLQRKVNRSGEAIVFSPRLGVETELVPSWVKLRAGTYGEPTRFDTARASGRLHGTLGFDLKLFPWTVFGLFHESTEWRASAALDVAERYLSWGVSIGLWH